MTERQINNFADIFPFDHQLKTIIKNFYRDVLIVVKNFLFRFCFHIRGLLPQTLKLLLFVARSFSKFKYRLTY